MGVCRVTLRPGHQVVRFPCGQGRYVLHARCAVEARARDAALHHSAAHKSGTEPSLRDLTHCKQRSKRTQVFAIEPHGWEEGPHSTRTYAAPSFGMGGIRTAWM